MIQSIIIARTNKNKKQKSPLASQKLGHKKTHQASSTFSKLARALHLYEYFQLCTRTWLAIQVSFIHNIGKQVRIPPSHPIPFHPIPRTSKVLFSFPRSASPSLHPHAPAPRNTLLLVPCHVIRLALHGGFKLRFASPFLTDVGKFSHCVVVLYSSRFACVMIPFGCNLHFYTVWLCGSGCYRPRFRVKRD